MREPILRIAGAVLRNMPARLCAWLLGSAEFLNRVAVIALLQKRLGGATSHGDQAALLREVAARCGPRVIYLEFGVWRGDSMRTAIDVFAGRDADFFGFDSFEGLPDDWNRYFGNRMAAGAFDTGGTVPAIGHDRVTFVKGWFEDTLPEFLRGRPDVGDPASDLIVYLDADLYHPTLFVLHRIAGVRDRFHIVCDDWTGGTGEAVWSFARTSGFRMRFIGKVTSDVHGLPKKVSLELARAGADELEAAFGGPVTSFPDPMGAPPGSARPVVPEIGYGQDQRRGIGLPG